MARMARVKNETEGGCYHVWNHVVGRKREYLFQDPEVKERLIGFIRHYAQAYFAQVQSLTIMDNHFHLVIQFEAVKELTEEEWLGRALRFYPGSKEKIKEWSQERWERFKARIFDISEYMRNVTGKFAQWYNARFDRAGHLFRGRFRSTLLSDDEANREAVLYSELNAVRAGMVERPEEYIWSSAAMREQGKDDWLASLQGLFPGQNKGEIWAAMKEQLYFRGAVPGREGQAVISPKFILALEGVEERPVGDGTYRQRHPGFACGVILGLANRVEEYIEKLSHQRFFQRYFSHPRRPVPLALPGHLAGLIHHRTEQKK